MRPPGSGLSRHATAGRRAALAAVLLLAAGACVSTPEEPPPLPPRAGPAAGGLRVELSFGREADLDLYVTDPQLETVYFANSPSRQGGVLLQDQRCDMPPPRIETVVFAHPPPGRYRVGVDFPQRCRLVTSPVPFLVRVDAGEVQLEKRGEISFPSFLPVVLEFELPAP